MISRSVCLHVGVRMEARSGHGGCGGCGRRPLHEIAVGGKSNLDRTPLSTLSKHHGV